MRLALPPVRCPKYNPPWSCASFQELRAFVASNILEYRIRHFKSFGKGAGLVAPAFPLLECLSFEAPFLCRPALGVSPASRSDEGGPPVLRGIFGGPSLWWEKEASLSVSKVSCDELPGKQKVTRERILCLNGKEGRLDGLLFQSECLALYYRCFCGSYRDLAFWRRRFSSMHINFAPVFFNPTSSLSNPIDRQAHEEVIAFVNQKLEDTMGEAATSPYEVPERPRDEHPDEKSRILPMTHSTRNIFKRFSAKSLNRKGNSRHEDLLREIAKTQIGRGRSMKYRHEE